MENKMENKTKLIIGISLGLVAAAGAYILIAKPFKTKEKAISTKEEAPKDKTTALSKLMKSTKINPAITIKKPNLARAKNMKKRTDKMTPEEIANQFKDSGLADTSASREGSRPRTSGFINE
jgi:archaellin